MNEISTKNPSSSGNKDTRLTLLEELKLKFESRSKLILLKSAAEIPPCTSPQLERSIGTIYIEDDQKFIEGPFMSESLISNTTTDISEIDNDQLDELIPEIELNDPFREEIEDDASNNKNKESPRALLNVDNVWEIGESVLVQGRPALKSLWEELMKERNEHHKTAYTLESLQKMYYTELQKNATLQNNIDKLRFLGGSSPTTVKAEPEPVLSRFKKPFEKITNVSEKQYEDETISSISFSTTSSQRKVKFKRITESSESILDFTNLISPKTGASLQLNYHFDVSPSKDQVDYGIKSEKFNKSSQVSFQSLDKTENSDKQPTDEELIGSVSEVDNFGLINNHKLDDLNHLNPNLGSVNTYSLFKDEEQPVQEIKRKIAQRPSKNECVVKSDMGSSFHNLPSTLKPSESENHRKQANILRLYKALESADQQSSFLQRRSREMLSYFTRLNIHDKR